MDIIKIIKERYSTKKFDPNKKINETTFKQVKELIRFAPSSLNLQPWRVFYGNGDNFKQRVLKAIDLNHPYNVEKVKDCSHVLIFTTKQDLDINYINHTVSKEMQDGRLENETIKQERVQLINKYVEAYRRENNISHWLEEQTYINIGSFLLAVAALNIDALAIGGYDKDKLDAEFKFTQQGLVPSLIICIGYRSEKDIYQSLPKSRLDEEEIIKEIK